MRLFELRGISKNFGAIQALTEVDLKIDAGEVLGLMGDNGAGKSTLIKIMAGNFLPSSGEIWMKGVKVEFHNPVDARRKGIEVVYQDLALCDNLTAAENVFLGREAKRKFGPFSFVHYAAMFRESARHFAELKSETRPRDLVRQMSGGQRQAVAIARTRLSNPDIVLMDEPTAAISVRQVAEVLELIRRLRDQNVAVILISHRMPDVFAVCDHVSVMRRGKVVADKPIKQTSPEEVTGLITGAIENRLMSETPMKESLEEIAQRRDKGPLREMLRSQPFWVTIALGLMCVVMSQMSNVFFTEDNFFNVTRNFAFIGIIAMGMTAVIITGGIDLSVGSVVGISGMVTAMVLHAGYPWWAGITAGLLTALACGLVNGILIAYVRLSSFIVTLGMFGIARSLAQVLSENHMIYEFGPDEKIFFEIGGGMFLGLANPFILLVLLTVFFTIVFRYTTWGRWVYAIGGNENAARLTGVPVNRMKLSVYVLSSLMAGISAVLLVSWQGAAINAMGTGYELRVIASSVIGGADLMGGAGGAYGSFIGAALIEVIRNSLLLAGVDANWEGTFVGLFIVFAVLLSKFRGMRSG